jgi:hypothetical protein
VRTTAVTGTGTAPPTTPATPGSPWRRTVRAVWAATLTGLLGLLFTALTALTVVVWASDPSYSLTNPVVDLAFFALGGIIVTAGFASQIATPSVAGLQQALLGLLTLSVAGWLGGRIEPFLGALLLLGVAAPLIVLHPDRRRLSTAGSGASRPLAALAAAAAGPAVAYAGGMLALARAAGPSCFFGQCVQGDRYAEAAALAVALVLVAMLAAVRTPGWRVSAWSAGTAAAVLGVTSLLFPGEVGALDAAWAVMTILWGAAVVTIAHGSWRIPPHRLTRESPASAMMESRGRLGTRRHGSDRGRTGLEQ